MDDAGTDIVQEGQEEQPVVALAPSHQIRSAGHSSAFVIRVEQTPRIRPGLWAKLPQGGAVVAAPCAFPQLRERRRECGLEGAAALVLLQQGIAPERSDAFGFAPRHPSGGQAPDGLALHLDQRDVLGAEFDVATGEVCRVLPPSDGAEGAAAHPSRADPAARGSGRVRGLTPPGGQHRGLQVSSEGGGLGVAERRWVRLDLDGSAVPVGGVDRELPQRGDTQDVAAAHLLGHGACLRRHDPEEPEEPPEGSAHLASVCIGRGLFGETHLARGHAMTDLASMNEKTCATWRLVIAYHGRDFLGWQAQAGARTVQSELSRALAAIAGEPVWVRAAGRTDAGVHARGQVVSCRFASRVPAHKMVLALGSHLPDDLSVVRAESMPEDFDAKRHSIGKRYVYRVLNQTPRDPFWHDRAWHIRGELDVEAMRRAAACFLGEQDFESFRHAQCDAAHARRYLWRVDLAHHGTLLELDVRGNAFCRHMIRIIAGTLVDIGRGRFAAGDVPDMFAARNRQAAGITAPPYGLTLERVYYPDDHGDADIPPGACFPGWPLTD